MKYATLQRRATRQAENASPRASFGGQEAVSIAPPEYGIDFVDSGMADTIQKKENKTGLPDKLKDGVESLSGLNMDDVKVHYNSARPAELEALAYAHGSDIHVGPGQEKHLPHEAWHVAQQKQGRVKPTIKVDGVPVNASSGLEEEADRMGRRAAARLGDSREAGDARDSPYYTPNRRVPKRRVLATNPTALQRVKVITGGKTARTAQNRKERSGIIKDAGKKFEETIASWNIPNAVWSTLEDSSEAMTPDAILKHIQSKLPSSDKKRGNNSNDDDNESSTAKKYIWKLTDFKQHNRLTADQAAEVTSLIDAMNKGGRTQGGHFHIGVGGVPTYDINDPTVWSVGGGRSDLRLQFYLDDKKIRLADHDNFNVNL